MTPIRSNLSLKRKRHEAASDVLKRPFATPAKHQRCDDDADSNHKSRLIKQSSSPGPSPESGTSSTNENLVEATPQVDRPDRKIHHSSASVGDYQGRSIMVSGIDSKVANDDMASQIRRIAAQIQHVRGEIDTLERAASILASRNDEHLNKLIAKWRNVAQEAADELFPDVKKRVEANVHRNAWCGSAGGASSSYEDTFIDQRAVEGDDSGQLIATDPIGSSSCASIGSMEDKPFNMEVMLQMLNIDPTLIRYDVDKEMWI